MCLFDSNGILIKPFVGDKSQSSQIAQFYRKLLCEEILPWWTRHAIDDKYGGICSCIKDDGEIISYDKYVWSQVRALWTFSATCNRVQATEEWQYIAKELFRFVINKCQRSDGDWNFLLDRQGNVKDAVSSIQTNAFAICAMVEYFRLSKNEQALEAAMKTYKLCLNKLAKPGSYATKPYPIPQGTKAHRVSMQFSLAFCELGKIIGDDNILKQGLILTEDILEHFRRPELQAIVEYISTANELLPAPVGTYIGPGHGIETAWFQIENLRGHMQNEQLSKILQIMSWSLERGWDQDKGGLFLGVDIKGEKPYIPNAGMKIWWPHCEALCGTLMAYEVSHEQRFLDWFQRVHNWAFEHFPDRQHGEWTQKLDEYGRKTDKVVALPVKDPFHLPRSLIYSLESLNRIAG